MAETSYQQQISKLLKKQTKFKPIFALAPNQLLSPKNQRKTDRNQTLSPRRVLKASEDTIKSKRLSGVG